MTPTKHYHHLCGLVTFLIKPIRGGTKHHTDTSSFRDLITFHLWDLIFIISYTVTNSLNIKGKMVDFDGVKLELKKALQNIMIEETKAWLIRSLLRKRESSSLRSSLQISCNNGLFLLSLRSRLKLLTSCSCPKDTICGFVILI